MQIGELARLSGLSTKTIRFYESIGLLASAARSENNYRYYHIHDLDQLRFIAGARMLGLSIATITRLIAAFEQEDAPCAAVQETLNQQLIRIDQQIAELLALRTQINQLRSAGAVRPIDRNRSACVCALIATYPTRIPGAISLTEEAYD